MIVCYQMRRGNTAACPNRRISGDRRVPTGIMSAHVEESTQRVSTVLLTVLYDQGLEWKYVTIDSNGGPYCSSDDRVEAKCNWPLASLLASATVLKLSDQPRKFRVQAWVT